MTRFCLSWAFTPWQRRGTLLALILAGCTPAPMARPGYSSTPAAEPAARPTAALPPSLPGARGIDPAVFARLVAATDQPYPSQGHEPPAYLVQVWVNPEALDSYRHWAVGSSLPVGTWLLAKHHLRRPPPNTDPAVPIYSLYRDTGGWRYGAITPLGLRIPVQEGVCHDCHTQARADGVFGPPVSAAAKPAQPTSQGAHPTTISE